MAAAYSKQYWNHRAEYAQIGEFLSQIPEDAPVAATTFYTTPLSQREVLYDVRYCSQEHLLSTQYVVLDTEDSRSYTSFEASGANGYQNLVQLLESHGYTLIDAWKEKLVIYQREVN